MEKLIKLTTAAGDFIEFNAVSEEATVLLLGLVKVLEAPEFETGIVVTVSEKLVDKEPIDPAYVDWSPENMKHCGF